MTREASDFYSQGAEEFAENYSIDNINENYLDLVEDFAEKIKGEKVLDAGCGPGRDSQLLSNKGFNVKGIDLSGEMMKLAKEKDGEFHVMDVRDLAFDDNIFDGILANQLLIFFEGEERKEAFNELSRVLKSGGVLFLGSKKGEGKFVRERYGSSVNQYPMKEKEARELLSDFEIHRIDKAEREGDQPGFMNFIARKK